VKRKEVALSELRLRPKQHLSKRTLTILWLFLFAWFPLLASEFFRWGQSAMAMPYSFKSNRTIKQCHFGKSAATELDRRQQKWTRAVSALNPVSRTRLVNPAKSFLSNPCPKHDYRTWTMITPEIQNGLIRNSVLRRVLWSIRRLLHSCFFFPSSFPLVRLLRHGACDNTA